MKAILYSRISSKDQNQARQLESMEAWAKRNEKVTEFVTISEAVSGSVPFADRQGGEIFKMKDVALVVVHDLDRLGRNALDILSTIQELHKRGIPVAVVKLGMETLLPNGKENPAAKIVLSVMATLAEMERERIRERQAEGIAIAKRQGKYKGRKAGTTDSRAKFLTKHKDVQRELKAGLSVRKAAKLTGKSPATVQKVKAAMA